MNIFLTPALPHGWALQPLQKRKGHLYKGNCKERSSDGRLKTENLDEEFESSQFFSIFIILGWNQKFGWYGTDLQIAFFSCKPQTYSMAANNCGHSGRSRQEQLIPEDAVSPSLLQAEIQHPETAETCVCHHPSFWAALARMANLFFPLLLNSCWAQAECVWTFKDTSGCFLNFNPVYWD